jgi:hypothetical protein
LGVGCDAQVVGVWPSFSTQLAISRVAPNPIVSGRDVMVSFTLPTAERATMDVLDAGGRRVTRQALNETGAGDHRIQLRIRDLPPGIYWLQVAQAGRAAASKVCVLP